MSAAQAKSVAVSAERGVAVCSQKECSCVLVDYVSAEGV